MDRDVLGPVLHSVHTAHIPFDNHMWFGLRNRSVFVSTIFLFPLLCCL